MKTFKELLSENLYNKNSISHETAKKIKKTWNTSEKYITNNSVLISIKRPSPEKIIHEIMGGYADERGFDDNELNNLTVDARNGKATMTFKKISSMEYEILIKDK